MKGLLKIRARAKASELLIFGDIGDLGFDGTVKAKDIVEQLAGLKADTLLVRINSYGGRVDEGLAIYNALRAFPGTVTTRVEGMAASIASVIAMAGARVEMARGSMMMIHAASSFAGGTAEALKSAADSLEKTDQTLSEIYARKTGRTAEQELDLIKSTGDRWMTADEAVEQGYADAIYDPDEQTASAAAPAYCDGLLHHLPTAGAFAGVVTAHLARIRLPSAARAAATSPEILMNWKTLAQALGIKLAADADDSAARLAVAKHYKLTDDATDDDIAAAMAAAGNDGSAPSAAAAAAPQASAEQQRRTQIEELFAIAMQGRQDRAQLTAMRSQALIGADSVADVRERLVAHLSGGSPVQGGAAIGTVVAGEDQREKLRAAGVNWILARANVLQGEQQRKALAGNDFRGMNLHDIARVCLEEAGVSTKRMNRVAIIENAITHSTSDFPNIFENALHKTLLAGFTAIPTTYDKVCRIGVLSDFRPHIRYRSSSIGNLQVRLENGEYKTLKLSDAERESITAQSRGGIVNVNREMLINDDMGVFTDLAMNLGKSARRTREVALYTLLASNPVMGDTKTLFHADHGNISADPGAPTMARIDADRVKMASQTDPGSNDFVDIRPSIWLGPIGLGSTVRSINGAQYDPDTPNKLQKPNVVLGLYDQILDTPRLSGTAYYSLAAPAAEPVFEIGFLDGQQEPQLSQQESFTTAGMSWRIVDEWGIAAIGWRGIVKNAGA